jgi:hypothetical protein
MNLCHKFGGRTLVFAVLATAVICDAFGIWVGWLSNSATGCFAPLAVGEGELSRRRRRPTLGTSSLTGPVAPRPPGSFYDLNSRPCLLVDKRDQRSSRCREPIGFSQREKSDNGSDGRMESQRGGGSTVPSGRFFDNGNRLGYDCNWQS